MTWYGSLRFSTVTTVPAVSGNNGTITKLNSILSYFRPAYILVWARQVGKAAGKITDTATAVHLLGVLPCHPVTYLRSRWPHEERNVAVLVVVQQRPHLFDEHIVWTETVWIHLQTMSIESRRKGERHVNC